MWAETISIFIHSILISTQAVGAIWLKREISIVTQAHFRYTMKSEPDNEFYGGHGRLVYTYAWRKDNGVSDAKEWSTSTAEVWTKSLTYLKDQRKCSAMKFWHAKTGNLTSPTYYFHLHMCVFKQENLQLWWAESDWNPLNLRCECIYPKIHYVFYLVKSFRCREICMQARQMSCTGHTDSDPKQCPEPIWSGAHLGFSGVSIRGQST